MFNDGFADGTIAGNDVDHSGGEVNGLANFGEEEGGEGGEFGRFEDDGVSGGEGGGNLPAEHEEWKVPGDDLPAHTNWLIVLVLFGGDFGPSGMIVEVTCDEGDIDIAGLADWFAVIEGFEDGEESGVFLDLSGDGVEVFGAADGGESLPRGECGLG